MKTQTNHACKRILLLAVLILLTPMSLQAFSGSGSGTEADPYIVTTATELDEVRNDLSAHYKLGNDINLGVAPWNQGNGWISLGRLYPSGYTSFTGSLDGSGHRISGMTIRHLEGVAPVSHGLFLETDGAEVKRLSLEDIDISGDPLGGAIALRANNSIIQDVHVNGLISSERPFILGGIVGQLIDSDLIDASFTGSITVGSEDVFSGAHALGGAVGTSQDSNIQDVNVAAFITHTHHQGNSTTGGILGFAVNHVVNNVEKLVNIKNCHFRGEIVIDGKDSAANAAGGIVGTGDSAVIEACSTVGSVLDLGEAGNGVGGICGEYARSVRNSFVAGNVFSMNSRAGGIMPGLSTTGTIDHCHVYATVENPSPWVLTYSGEEAVARGTVGNAVFYCTETAPGISTSGATGLSTSEFTNEVKFEGFDFDLIWTMGEKYPVLRDNPDTSTDIWQAWSRLGSFDLWSLFSDQLHSPILSGRVQSQALLVTASQGGTPLTDKQQIADLAVAMQAKLSAQETGFWDQSFIDSDDVKIFTTDVGFATEGFSYSGDFVLATPGVSQMWSSAAWYESEFLWPDTAHNAALKFAIPADGNGNVPAEFQENLDEAWSSGVGRFILPGHRRDMYAQTFLFGMFPEATTFSTLSEDLRARYQQAFDTASATSSLATAIQDGSDLEVSHLTEYMNIFASALSSDEAEVAAAVIDFALELAEAPVPVGTALKVAGQSVTASQQHELVAQMLVIKAIQAERVKRRRDYLVASFGTTASLPSSKWIGKVRTSIDGWVHDPGILFGLSDAVATVDAILAADSGEDMAGAILTDEEIWGVSGSNQALTALQGTAEVVVSLALVSNPVGQLALVVYKAAILGYEVHNYLQGELLGTSDAINMMFCAGTVDYYLQLWGGGSNDTLEGIRDLQTRTNIRMLMGIIYYGALVRNDSENMFYGSLSASYESHMTAQYSAVASNLADDFLLTNPVSSNDAVALAQAAYVADSVPGVINPQGQFNLTVESGVGGTASGEGVKIENSQAPISASADSGFRFGSWSGSGVADPSSATTTVLMDSDKTVTATFLEEFSVSVAATPIQGGSVSGGGVGVAGETVPITAAVNSGYRFGGWSGASGIADPSSLSTTVTTNADKIASAIFVKQWTLMLVNSNPERGSVGGGGLLDEGRVPIAATPGAGFRFGGWSGTGVAEPSDATTSVSLTQDRSVTATFLINSTDGYNTYSTIFGDETDINKIGPNMDFDGDFKTNFHEFVFGLNPTSPVNEPDTVASILQRGEDTHGQLTFKARSDDDEITYKVLVSGDLENWTPVTITYSDGAWASSNQAVLTVEAQTNRGDGTWNLTVEDKTPINAGSPRFFKVSAGSPYNN